jgi:RND family efflux transporter MFP subunit
MRPREEADHHPFSPAPGALARALAAAAVVFLAVSCRGRRPPPPAPPQVTVARPVEREITEWDEYTARLEATEFVEVRARVSGYLESIHFKDGALVKKGDLLFTIDPRPYQAAQRRAEGEQSVARARLDLAEKKLERSANLVAREAISKEEGDVRAAEARQAEAALRAATAAVEAATLEVEFTQIHSPIAGRVGRKLVTEGNLVNGGIGALGTLLTTIVSLDPLHAYFDADERAFLKYARLAKSGERVSSRERQNPVRIQLADEHGFPHEGYMDFVDNQLDRGTGTMIGRAVIPNPDLFLSPGLFARLQLLGRERLRVLLLPDAAVLFDQSERFVWVVDDRNQVQYRRVQVGRIYEGQRIIREGLQVSDRVIVAGVQRVRPGIVVSPEESPAAAPSPSPQAAREAGAPAGDAKAAGGQGSSR